MAPYWRASRCVLIRWILGAFFFLAGDWTLPVHFVRFVRMNKMKPSQFDHVVSFFFFGAVPLMVVALFGFHIMIGVLVGKDYATRGQFGDQFGAVNALFTGVAFMGLVLTTGLQAKATRQQTAALELEKEALENQAEELKAQRAEMRRSAEAQEEANRLSKAALVMELRRMEMDIALKRVDGAESVADREAHLREVERSEIGCIPGRGELVF